MSKKKKAELGYSVRGAAFVGLVSSAKMPKTVTVERTLTRYIPKYERYKKTKSKVKAHNPETINAKEGDIVRIGETRKISKTKSFIVLEIIKEGGAK
ncbi:MAG: 30S ribosomal protein S17 [archaeon]|nr:30S ribosomal protein S17 [archaeon]